MLRIAVCDDENACQDHVIKMIEAWSADSCVPTTIYTFDNGDALISRNATHRMDIIFLDIIMPLLDGIETAKELREKDKAVKIVFLTSSPEFALKSYDVKAYDYILKPIVYKRLKEVLDECSKSFDREPKNLVVKTSFGYQKIYFHDIEYVEAQNKKVAFYLLNGKMLDVAEPLYSFENKLISEDGFFKCHRSYLVFLPHVDHFNNVSITTKSGRCIPIARGFSKSFYEAYFNVMFKE